MPKKNCERFKTLWQKESNNKNALFVDISCDPDGFPLDTLFNVSKETKPATKDNKVSLDFRTKGNVAFGQKHWRDAMELYNKSLCFAEIGSENVSLAFGNRSACFFNLKMFDKRLVDIDLAIKANCPERLIEKLEKRKANCRTLIESGDIFVPFVPQLSFPPNEKFPSMSNVLQIAFSNKFGRHIITSSDIAVGETLLIEKAYVNKTIAERHTRCNICYRLDTNLVPCPQCTGDMLCYGECEQNEFHKIECDMKTLGGFDDISCFHLHIIRSVLIAIKTIPNVEDLMTFVEQTIMRDASEIPQSEPIDDLSKYRTFLQLSINSQNENDMFNWRVFFIYKTMLNNFDIRAKFATAQHQRFLMHFIGHHSGIIHYNARASIQSYGTTSYTTELQPLIASYFNHSCAPNVATVSYDDALVAIAIRPIKKDEQLFISYFGRDLHRTTEDRQGHFGEFFDFVCKCERCTKPFTLFTIPYNFEWFQSVLNSHYNKKFDFGNEANVKLFLEKGAEYAVEHGRKIWTDEVSCFIHMSEGKMKYKLDF